MVIDVTERERAEEALRESEERFRAFFDNSPTAMFLKGPDGRFQFVNKRFETWYGLSETEVVGRTSDEFFPRKFAEDSIFSDRAVLGSGEPRECQLSARFSDGGEHTIIVTKFPVRGSSGEIIGVGTINTDVTDQRQAEEHLRQAQKMEAVGQLTGGIAHEFNNLLMVVVGNIELLQSQLPDDGDLKRIASTAMKGAMRGAEMTQRLLTFSRKQTLAIVPIDLNGLVRGLHDMLRRTLGETITLEVEYAENLPKTMADRGQIEGALLNFVLNSRDAMPKGGTIIVRTSNTTLDAEAAAKADVDPGDYVSLEIADTGHGMTAETIEQAFEPFFTTKDVGEGTGLGLSVVYGFAKQSGGLVEIDSEIGRGTTLRLSLPCVAEAERATGEKAQIRAEPANGRAAILVVEDDPDVRAMVVGLLIDLGYDTVEAEDGQTALARLEAHPDIDLLFTDVVLPHGMSGQDVAREARRRRPDLKVVFTSGYSDTGDGDRLEDDDRTEFVCKPYRKSKLAEKLAAVLNM
jgi:PAS domain S-box-containing protein